MQHLHNRIIFFLLTFASVSAVMIAFVTRTPTGRELVICKSLERIQQESLKDATARSNLALVGQAWQEPLPATMPDWHYVKVENLVVPLPLGHWQRLDPESSRTRFIAETKQLRVQVEVYPYQYDLAAAKIQSEQWWGWLLGDTLTRIKQPIIAAFRRDLAANCDPNKDFRQLLLESLLVGLKLDVSNSGRTIAARWGRAPSRFLIAYENSGVTTIRYTQKSGSDALVLTYETRSAELARQILDQSALISKTNLAKPYPKSLQERPVQQLNLKSAQLKDTNLPMPGELCQEIIAKWHQPIFSSPNRFIIPFEAESLRLSHEGQTTLKNLIKSLEKHSASVVLTAIPSPNAKARATQALEKSMLEGAIRLALIRNSDDIAFNILSDPTVDSEGVIGPAILAHLETSVLEPKLAALEAVNQSISNSLLTPIQARMNYIRSRRRGAETPVVGIASPQLQGPFSINLSEVSSKISERLPERQVLIKDLQQLPGLLNTQKSGLAITLDAATNLRDCLAVDFLLVPTLITSFDEAKRTHATAKFEVRAQLIELSTLDIVGNWTTMHATEVAMPSRFPLGTLNLGFKPGSDQLTTEAQQDLQNALRTLKAYPYSSLKIRAIAQMDEVIGPDQDAACLTLAGAREQALRKIFVAADGIRLRQLERSAAPICSSPNWAQGALLEFWSEPETNFWELSWLN